MLIQGVLFICFELTLKYESAQIKLFSRLLVLINFLVGDTKMYRNSNFFAHENMQKNILNIAEILSTIGPEGPICAKKSKVQDSFEFL